jgi:quercetin 2,3-dioxygenase
MIMSIVLRKSEDRGYFDHGSLKTYHTFSFGGYQDTNYISFRSLRVLNEDRLKPGTGFPSHPHENMEIISIILKGAIAHQDNFGHSSIITAGSVQMMSAGKGIFHSECNASDKEEVHFLQIWIIPKKKSGTPKYQEKKFPAEGRSNQLQLIVSPGGKAQSLTIDQDAFLYLAQLDAEKEIQIPLGKQRNAWMQIVSGKVICNQKVLQHGDGAAIREEESIIIKAEEPSEFVWIDLS